MNGILFSSIFERVAVINLASRADRRRDVTEELSRVGLAPGDGNAEFFDAVRPSGPGDFPSIGAHGCFLSHLALLERCAVEGVRSVLILEDDVGFVRDIGHRMRAVCEGLHAAPWDIFYGGYKEMPGIRAGGHDASLGYVDSDEGIGLAHCIGLRGAAIAEAAGYLRAMLSRPAGSTLGGPMHVDGAYSWYRKAHDARRTIVAFPPIAIQRPSRSDIFENLAWYDKTAALRPLVSSLRRVKRKLT